MNKTRQPVFWLFAVAVPLWLLASCANIIPPVGGARDSLAPILIRATPAQETRNFRGKNIILLFNEYVEIQNAFDNVLVSPSQDKFPTIDYKLRNVTVKMRDTLEPNTTYSIQFGDAIKDVNEGNVLKHFTYVFSTGNSIDSFSLEGTVQLAETGKTDSTLIVVLHRNLYDSAVAKEKPRYIARVDGTGHYRFEYLPAGTFGLFALKDEGFKKYTDNQVLFAFADAPVKIGPDNAPIDLLAFSGEKEKPKKQAAPKAPAASKDPKEDKRLKFKINLENNQQNLLKPLQLVFDKPLRDYDSSRILLTDTLFHPVTGYQVSLDSSRTVVSVRYPWLEQQPFLLLLQKDVMSDSAGNTFTRNDTVRFVTRPEVSYGSLQVRFNGIDLKKHPVLQWVQGDQLYASYPITAVDWKIPRFEPGAYEMRILYDSNGNGVWDTGNYWKKKQPEQVISIDQKFNVRANWDNEFTVLIGSGK